MSNQLRALARRMNSLTRMIAPSPETEQKVVIYWPINEDEQERTEKRPDSTIIFYHPSKRDER